MRAVFTTALLTAGRAPHRTLTPTAFFGGMFGSKPQSNPADVYNPDSAAPPSRLPSNYDELQDDAIQGILAAVEDGLPVCEVGFPPISRVNARGDGSAKSEALVVAANAEFVEKLVKSFHTQTQLRVDVFGCGAAVARACMAERLRSDTRAVDGCDVAICVSPADIEQWEAAEALGAPHVVIVNGLLYDGFAPHAYYYKPLTAFSAQTGGCVRRYPGPYQIFYATGEPVTDMEVKLARQGRRALPDTKEAQMLLQNHFGRMRGSQ